MSTVTQYEKSGTGREARFGAAVGQDLNTAGFGIPLGSSFIDPNGATRTAAVRVGADDGGTALPAGEYRGLQSRFLVSTAVTANVTASGSIGHLKVQGVSLGGIGNKAGLCGYLELAGGATITGGLVASGVWGRVDVPSGNTIGASQVVSAFASGPGDLGGTHTGTAAVLHVATPAAGTWDSLINVTAGCGCYTASDVGAAANKKLIVSVDGVAYAIKLYAVS